VLDFSTPYLLAAPGVLVRAGTRAPDEAALRELRWVALASSTLTDVLEDQVRPEHDPLVVDTRSDALAAIDAGRADAMLLDLPVALARVAAKPDHYEVVGQLLGQEGLAAALPRGSDNLDAVDSAIRAFVADGTIDDLSQRWLGADLATGAEDVPLIRTES
jgi:polar amino acid transport system substrate-binding protein